MLGDDGGVEMSHTPGPWEVVRDHPTRESIAYIRHGDISDMANEIAMLFVAGSDKRRADARLIAAAPELLETLQAMRAQWIHSVHAERVLAVIAKATGESA